MSFIGHRAPRYQDQRVFWYPIIQRLPRRRVATVQLRRTRHQRNDRWSQITPAAGYGISLSSPTWLDGSQSASPFDYSSS